MSQTNTTRDIPGYEGKYAITPNGSLYSYARKRYLKPFSKYGYLKVCLSSGGRQKQHSVHRLVYETYVGPIPKSLGIDHKDGDKVNNSVANLRSCNQTLNNANTLGRPNKRRGLYKGVLPAVSSKTKPWRAVIGYGGLKVHLGNFASPHEAALEYNHVAEQLFGEYALTNTVNT